MTQEPHKIGIPRSSHNIQKQRESWILWALIGSNLVGFFSASICYLIGLYTGAITAEGGLLDPALMRSWFFGGIMMTWVACAVISPAAFFASGIIRALLIGLPAIAPLVYGFSLLSGIFTPS